MYDYLEEEIAMIRLPSSEELNKSDLLQKFHINSHLTASINAGASILCTDNLSGGVCAAGISGSVIPFKSTSRNTAIRQNSVNKPFSKIRICHISKAFIQNPLGMLRKQSSLCDSLRFKPQKRSCIMFGAVL